MVSVKYNINEIGELIAKDLREKGIKASNMTITKIQVGSLTFANPRTPKTIEMGAGARLDIFAE